MQLKRRPNDAVKDYSPCSVTWCFLWSVSRKVVINSYVSLERETS